MAKRQREWARRTRDKLHAHFGGQCSKCGATENLELDVIISVDNEHGKARHHRDMEWSWRMSFYRKQLAEKNLDLLCDHCNGRKRDNPF